MEASSWWLDTARLYLRYAVAVVCSIPIGIVYVYLAANKLDRWWAVDVLLVVGLGLATAGWRISEHMLASREMTMEVANRESLVKILEFNHVNIGVGSAASLNDAVSIMSTEHITEYAESWIGGDDQLAFDQVVQVNEITNTRG